MAQLYSLYVVYRDGRTLLQKDFQIENMEPDLVTGFLSAISMFLSDLVGRISENGQKLRTLEREDGRLRVIDREDVKILLEYGKNIYVAVFSTDDLPAIRDRMRTLINIMERQHGELLENWLGDLSHFRDIAPQIDLLFRPYAVSERYIPIRIHTVPKSQAPEELHPFLEAIDGNRSIEDIAKELQQPVFRVMLDYFRLQHLQAVQLERHLRIEQLVTPKD
ncbi:MAG: hypothetical protein ACFE9D_03460 [Promethearchaeota archaeon]